MMAETTGTITEHYPWPVMHGANFGYDLASGDPDVKMSQWEVGNLRLLHFVPAKAGSLDVTPMPLNVFTDELSRERYFFDEFVAEIAEGRVLHYGQGQEYRGVVWSGLASALTQDIGLKVDSLAQFVAEVEEQYRNSQKAWQAYHFRLEKLRQDAELEDITINEVSEVAFLSFVRATPFGQRAQLVVMDNGNLRAIWKGNEASHVGIHFRGSNWAEYVIFKRRTALGSVSRTAGIDTLEGIKRQIDAFDLTALVYG